MKDAMMKRRRHVRRSQLHQAFPADGITRLGVRGPLRHPRSERKEGIEDASGRFLSRHDVRLLCLTSTNRRGKKTQADLGVIFGEV